MKLKKKLFKYRTGLLMTAGCIIIMVITLFFVGEKNVPYVLGDEFGYWTSAAYFFGYDWSGIASINGYFSFGYGLLLTPLFLLKDSVLMYRTAIVMNALFLVGSFALAYIAGQKLFPKIRAEIILLLAFAASVYPSYLGYVQTNMSESLLLCLSWVVINLLLSLEKRDTAVKIIGLGITVGYAYMVHMRALALVAACIVYLIYLFYRKKITLRNLCLFLIIILSMIVITHVVKAIITSNVYLDGSLSGSNDYAGQLGKIKYIFTFQGMIDFINSILGKLFYLGAATYTVFYWGIVRIYKEIRNIFKPSALKDTNHIYIFLAVLLIFTIGISSIFMVFASRVDVLMYGRYNEHILGLFILAGLYEILYFLKKKTCTIMMMVHILLGLFIAWVINKNNITDINSFNIMGIFRYMCTGSWEVIKDDYMYAMILSVAVLTICIYIIFIIFQRLKVIALVSIIGIYLYAYFGTYTAMANGQYAVQNFKYKEICEVVESEDNVVYCVYSEKEDTAIAGLWGGRIQFLNPQSKIVAVDIENLETENCEDSLIFTKSNSKVLPYLFENYINIGRSDDFEMFQGMKIDVR